mgnify:CR=1 FL=1
MLVEGLDRALLRQVTQEEPFLLADIELLPEMEVSRATKRDLAMVRQAQELFMEYASLVPQMASDVVMHVVGAREPGPLSDYIAQNTQMAFEQKQQLLETQDPRRRMGLLLHYLSRENEILRLEQDIQEKVKESMDKGQRDYYSVLTAKNSRMRSLTFSRPVWSSSRMARAFCRSVFSFLTSVQGRSRQTSR